VVEVNSASPITWRISKWSGSPHRSVGLVGLEVTEDGMWGAIRAGSPVDDPTGQMTQFLCDAVVFFPTGRWWSAVWLTGMPTDLYVDICTPAHRHNNEVVTVDLDLDVVSVYGQVQILDRDEFEEHSARWHYPPHVVTNAEAAASYVALAIVDKQFPFDGAHRAMSARFLI
jgi:hypothetical protein